MTTDVPGLPEDDDDHAHEHIVWKADVQLEFDRIDAEGFGHAHDPKTRDRFTVPVNVAKSLGAGQRFRAVVTKSHFVAKVIHH